MRPAIGPVATFDGTYHPDTRIYDGTDPWVEVNGQPVNWNLVTITPVRCPCSDPHPTPYPGTLPNGTNVQRCDLAGIFDGDLDAALALARMVDGVVKYHQQVDRV